MDALNPDLEREILDAVRGIRYGSVEVVVHDAKVVQVVRTEKVRIDSPRDGRQATSTR
jgi:hypothetical protein